MRYTPEEIVSLNDREVFVFGSNLAGIHGAGAAKVALEKFGAVYGQGIGRQGRSYAIPTKDTKIKPLPIEEIRKHVEVFLAHAEKRPLVVFLVTKIGCGLRGLTPDDIAPMFTNHPFNVILPREFHDVINKQPCK